MEEKPQSKYIAKSTILKALRQLEKQHGVIRPADLVEYARPEDSRLHSLFEWDDAKAAQKYRLWEARQIIVNVYININESKVQAFQNIVVTTPKGKTQGYYSTQKILSKEEMRKQLIETCKQEAMYFFNKWKLISELTPLETTVKDFFDELLGEPQKKKTEGESNFILESQFPSL